MQDEFANHKIKNSVLSSALKSQHQHHELALQNIQSGLRENGELSFRAAETGV